MMKGKIVKAKTLLQPANKEARRALWLMHAVLYPKEYGNMGLQLSPEESLERLQGLWDELACAIISKEQGTEEDKERSA